jgi:hypothetical protein
LSVSDVERWLLILPESLTKRVLKGLPKDVTVMDNGLLRVILEKGCEVPASELTLHREPNRAITVPA